MKHTMSISALVAFLGLFSVSLAFTAEYVPESYYIIDSHGRQSEKVYFHPRVRRNSAGSGSYSSSYSSSNSGSGNVNPQDFFVFPNFFPQGFPNNIGFQPGYGPTGNPSSHSSSSASSSSQSGGHPSAHRGNVGFATGSAGGSANGGSDGLTIHTRFGGDEDKDVKGVFSSSSSAVDKDGKVTYHVQTGKF